MFLLVSFIVAATAFDPQELEQGLGSLLGQVELFSSWMNQEQIEYYSLQETSARFRLFTSRLTEIVAINNAQDSYVVDANFMAGLTDAEQKMYQGINSTLFPADINSESDESMTVPAASEVDWKAKGKITPVKNQGYCGSCWAFGGTAAFEGRYSIQTGAALKRFSEQEMLDCTYEIIDFSADHDGCTGGWYWDAYAAIQKTRHLATEADYPYEAKDGRCRYNEVKNGMSSTRLVGIGRPAASANDASLVQALNSGPVVIAFEIKGGFSYYQSGILSVRDCGRSPHHAMAVTGYTSNYFELKNSWGSRWGDAGYVKFDRMVENMCGISNWLAYPKLVVLTRTEEIEE